MTRSTGRDSDAEGKSGTANEKTREAQAGETGTTRFGMVEEGTDTDGPGTAGAADDRDNSAEEAKQ